MGETPVEKSASEEIRETLEEVKALIESDKELTSGRIVCTTMPEGEQRWSFITKDFILDAVDPENYYLSFTINNYRIGRVSLVTHLLTLMLYDQLKLVEDNFIDINTNTVYYGDEAYEQFAEFVKKKNGLVTCPVCDITCTEEMYISEKGYCRLCERDVLPYVTYH